MYVQFVVNNLRKMMLSFLIMENVGERRILIIGLNQLLGVKILTHERLMTRF
jgi:hypothetical protein